MSSFFDLVGFEYKKIFKRKSTAITLILVTVLTILSTPAILIGYHYIDGHPSESKYDSMVKDREYARALAGRALDEDLILETKNAYLNIPLRDKYNITPEYEEYARPYSPIYYLVRTVYNRKESKRFGLEAMQTLSIEDIQNYYEARSNKIFNEISHKTINDNSKEKLLKLDNKIETPFVFDYTDGYTRFFAIMYTTGIISAFAIAICIAPIFAGEYTTGADQLILSSKFGKNKLISAKLFTSISFSSVVCIALSLLTYFECMLIFGFDGANAPFQLLLPLCTYPFKMWQVAALFSICILFGAIFTTAITLWLSSKFKSPFGVIIIVSILTFAPMMLNVSENNVFLYNLFNLLPSSMMGIWSVSSPILFELFGLSIEPYIFMPIFAVFATIIILPFAYRSFKNHQIG